MMTIERRLRLVCCFLAALSFSLSRSTNAQQVDSLAQAPVLSDSAGVSLSEGDWTLTIQPMIVTQEFEGERVASPSAVILVFPYTLTGPDGQRADIGVNPILPDFLDENGNDLRLPTTAFYSRELRAYYFQTFGPRELLERGLWVVALRSGGPRFPPIRLQATGG